MIKTANKDEEIKMELIGRTVKFEPKGKDSKETIMITDRDVSLNFSKCLHTTIIAKSGAGKSYLMRVLIESEIVADSFIPIVFDPLGIFASLKFKNPDPAVITWGLESKEMDVIVLIPEGDASECDPEDFDRTFTFAAKDIDYDTFAYTFNLEVNGQEYNLYRKAWNICKKANKKFELIDLKTEIRLNFEEWGYQSRTSEAVLSKVDALGDLGIIGNGTDLIELLNEEKPLIFDFSNSSKFSARVFVNVIAEVLCKYRRNISKKVNKNKAKGKPGPVETYFKPLAFYIDEAHLYFPHNEKLEDLCRMGRNIGVKITAVSQSANLNSELFANTLYWYIGPISFDKDIEKIAAMLPLARDLKQIRVTVKSLKTGCFLFYDAENKSELEKTIRIRAAMTMHLQNTEVSDEKKWITNYKSEKVEPEEFEDNEVFEDGEEFELSLQIQPTEQPTPHKKYPYTVYGDGNLSVVVYNELHEKLLKYPALTGQEAAKIDDWGSQLKELELNQIARRNLNVCPPRIELIPQEIK